MNAGVDAAPVNRARWRPGSGPPLVEPVQQRGDRLGVAVVAERGVDMIQEAGQEAARIGGLPGGRVGSGPGEPLPRRGAGAAATCRAGAAAAGVPRRASARAVATRARVSPASSTAVPASRQTSATRTSTVG